MRRSPKLAEVLPILYLRGPLSTGDFKDALGALLGDDASGLSPTSITRFDFLSAGCTLGVLATVVEAQSWRSPSPALPNPWTVERVDGVRS